jgi:hypothetical protein
MLYVFGNYTKIVSSKTHQRFLTVILTHGVNGGVRL